MVHRVFNSAQYLLVNVHHVVNGGQYVNQMARSVDYSAYYVNTALEFTRAENSERACKYFIRKTKPALG